MHHTRVIEFARLQRTDEVVNSSVRVSWVVVNDILQFGPGSWLASRPLMSFSGATKRYRVANLRQIIGIPVQSRSAGWSSRDSSFNLVNYTNCVRKRSRRHDEQPPLTSSIPPVMNSR